MPPPSPSRPRLVDLDPEAFAASVTSAITQHLRTLFLHTTAERPPTLDLSLLRRSVLRLALYARTGEPFDDPAGALQQLHQVLHGSPAALEAPADAGPAQDDPQDLPLTVAGWAKLVMLAARARLLLAGRQPLPVAELAALTDSSADNVRLKIRKGELATVGEGGRGALLVRHRDAKAWAESRTASLR